MIPDRIMRKIERCLALSQSANAHEAGIALRQAQRLMAANGLSEQDGAFPPSSAPTMARSSSPKPFGTGSAPSVQKRLTSSPDRPGRMVIARALTPASAMKC